VELFDVAIDEEEETKEMPWLVRENGSYCISSAIPAPIKRDFVITQSLVRITS